MKIALLGYDKDTLHYVSLVAASDMTPVYKAVRGMPDYYYMRVETDL
jgi:hypothetical protein